MVRFTELKFVCKFVGTESNTVDSCNPAQNGKVSVCVCVCVCVCEREREREREFSILILLSCQNPYNYFHALHNTRK